MSESEGGSSNLDGIATQLWSELVVVSRFGLVGVAATAVHMLAVWLLLQTTSLSIFLANLVAFMMAFGISFEGNYYWTFRSPGSVSRAIWRFLLISGSALAANTVLLAGLVRAGWVSPPLAAVLAATVIPLCTFLASRLWGFRSED